MKNKSDFHKRDINKEVTNRIVELLENHKTGKYNKTWFSASGEIFATNPLSNVTYDGLNQLILSFLVNEKGFTQNRWMTSKQAFSLGATVKRGSTKTPITYLSRKFIEKDSKRNVTSEVMEILKNGGTVPENVKEYRRSAYHLVLNIEQFDNMPEEYFFKGEKIEYSDFEKDELAEEILNKSGAIIVYKRFQQTFATILTGMSPNHYTPSKDVICLAERKQFKDTGGFYCDAFHELGHWTGHKDRLNRDLSGKFGSKSYALEELVAELFSAFICARLGFQSHITNNAAYISSWLNCLKDDKYFIFKAAAQADKAVKYVLDIVEHGVVLKPENKDILF